VLDQTFRAGQSAFGERPFQPVIYAKVINACNSDFSSNSPDRFEFHPLEISGPDVVLLQSTVPRTPRLAGEGCSVGCASNPVGMAGDPRCSTSARAS